MVPFGRYAVLPDHVASAGTVFPPPATLGVGSKDEESVSLMSGADVGCAKSSPFRIEPCFGKVSEDIGKPKGNVACDVLKERVSRS